MQLTDTRRALRAATVTLLGAATLPAVAAGTPDEYDAAMLVYSEGDSRVQVFEPALKWTHPLSAGRILSARVVLDTLSGATPTGATPSSTPQTVTGPSGGATVTTAAGKIPMDDSFEDTRFQGVVNYSLPVLAGGTLSGGLSGSTEYDFNSFGTRLEYAQDLFRHNTTLSAGVHVEFDQIDPVGGAPVPLSAKPMAGTGSGGGGESEGQSDGSNETKTVTDLMAGWTQVLSPKSLMQINYSVSLASGYQNDPYKILSVVGSDGEPISYVYEARPDNRNKQAIYARYKRFMFDRDIADVSYRYMHDDWGIRSSTVDLSYRHYAAPRLYFEPSIRWYTQTAADFYRVALYDGEQNQVDYASADPRLGQFDAWTVGMGVGGSLPNAGDWSARVALYAQNQTLTGVPSQAADGLSKFDLTPGLNAVMLTLGYRFKY